MLQTQAKKFAWVFVCFEGMDFGQSICGWGVPVILLEQNWGLLEDIE
ncbi:MAG: hypothetical protein ABS960_12525 [Solibacillus isronensis]